MLFMCLTAVVSLVVALETLIFPDKFQQSSHVKVNVKARIVKHRIHKVTFSCLLVHFQNTAPADVEA